MMNGTSRKDEVATFVTLLRACVKDQDLRSGIRLHDDILRRGLLEKCSDALVTLYAKCGALAKAKELFDRYKSRELFTWTAVMSGFAQNGHGRDALDYFEQLQHEGISADAVTYSCALKACAGLRAIDKGEKIHDEITKHGLLNHALVGNALVDMYVKCGDLAKAQHVLEKLSVRGVISWTSLIVGYAEYGKGEQALNYFDQMLREGLHPDDVTYVCILKACGSLKASDKGQRVHEGITKQGLLGKNVVLGTALVDMYCKCGALTKARRVLADLTLRNVISWTALISGYVESGQCDEALNYFEQMLQDNFSPNAVTFLCILKACGSIGAADKGDRVYEEIAKQGLLGKDIVLGTALVDMYAKCGALVKAQQVVEELPSRNVVTWNALISGYAEHGQGAQALKCFEQMRDEGLFPDVVTFISILKACGSIGAADKGERIHDEIAKQGFLGNNLMLGNALVDMYGKCGSLSKARRVLEELPERNVVIWTALITGYAEHGQVEQALNCFEEMQHEGLFPDPATFSCVLTACSRLGLVEDAQLCLSIMSTNYGMKPNVEHYSCMVDILGRAGHLDIAARMIEKIPSSNSVVCSSLLGACKKWGDAEVGRWAFAHAPQLAR